MTVSFLDTPGPLQNTSEPINFTTTAAVEVVAVYYASGTRDVVWMDGEFSPAYANSTAGTAGGAAWEIKRVGRWPVGFDLKVKEVPSGGQLFGLLYEVDLTAQATQSMTTAGAYTIDGYTWWAKGAVGVQSNALTNGSGIGIQGTNTTAFVSAGMSGAYTPRCLFFPFSQIEGFNPNAPTFVRWVATRSPGGGAGGSSVRAGITDGVDSSASTAFNERHKWHGVTIDGTSSNPSSSFHDHQGSLNGSSSNVSVTVSNCYPSPNAGLTYEAAILLLPGGMTGMGGYDQTQSFIGAWSGSWGDLTASTSQRTMSRVATRSNVGLHFHGYANPSQAAVYLQRLRIEQPRI